MAEPLKRKYNVARLTVEVISLALLTLTEAVVFITSGLAGATNAGAYGFINRTGAVSDKFFTQITPAGFTFSIWGVIYTWDILWILYAWSFVFRPNMQRTIFIPVYWIRTVINCLNIIWIYIWGNEKIVPASVILYIFAFTFYASNAVLVIYFRQVQYKAHKVDRVLTYILPINGNFVYCTWATIASQLNLTIAIIYNANYDPTDGATIGLTLLLTLVVGYFILESTVGERYLRYVFSVYPVIIWASIGVLAVHWRDETEESRNKIYVLALLIIAVLFLLSKVVLCIVCGRLRPNNRNAMDMDNYKEKESEENMS